MEKRHRTLAAVLTALMGVLVLAGCGDENEGTDPQAERQDTETERTTTELGNEEFGEEDVEAARTTLEGVINRAIKDRNYSQVGYRDDPAIGADLIAQIEGLREEAKQQGATGLDFDPFLCAQNVPKGVTFNEAGTAADRITLVGVYRFGPQAEKATYVLSRSPEGDWTLESTECVDAAQPRGE